MGYVYRENALRGRFCAHMPCVRREEEGYVSSGRGNRRAAGNLSLRHKGRPGTTAYTLNKKCMMSPSCTT